MHAKSNEKFMFFCSPLSSEWGEKLHELITNHFDETSIVD